MSATVKDRARGSCEERAPSGQNRPVWGSRRALRGLALARAGSPCSGVLYQSCFPKPTVRAKASRQALLRAPYPGQRTGLKRRSGVARRPRRRPPRAAHRGGKPPAHRALRHTEHSGTPRRRRGPEAHQGELEAKHQGSTERVCTTPFQHAPTGWRSVMVVRAAREAGAQPARRRAAPEERILCCSSPTLKRPTCKLRYFTNSKQSGFLDSTSAAPATESIRL